ncbi:hypothetical protein NC652_010042 [Populus alba x Populus x berolinensis]|nr:hypothetical protein NC652_010042 [Populus alba x Populus x berolinensis]
MSEDAARWKRTDRPSAAILKRKGDRGSPCLIPRPTLNSGEGEPLTKTET